MMFFRLRILLCAFCVPAFASVSARGIDNFHQVDANVYRGAQPTREGFEYLASIGVKTVIDLREADDRSAAEERIVTANGMKYVNVPMTGLTPPTEPEIQRILVMFENPAGPVFVHCKRGADRTGAVIAAYRIDHDGWDNARALREAMGNGMSFFQLPRQSFIRTFQRRVVDASNATPNSRSSVPDAQLTPATVAVN